MLARKPLAPNNRNGIMRNSFLAGLGSEAATIRYPKALEEPTVKHWARPGRQNSEGFGGGYRIRK
jgi:hypothetical protein